MFSQYTDVATIERLSAYSGDQSSMAAVDGSVFGILTPIDDSQNTIGLKFQGQGYRFTTSGANDVRTGDRLTIDSDVYIVRGVQKFKQKALYVLNAFCEKPQKQ